ncbi:hypothetical protein AU193_02060 [Mycobacterium sp. GA-1285]|uniref:hypothetical protein n=1 Tax=Mycobacterium sp. GA-1285 TaxID=1772282 RepID=UPI0007493EA0|nr:hypothetical protein [Mycobacterium sp. GA-1285]KUI11922.1 hypothetical protein AU193_02060 [Mycobacterium sp. GA-1285]
MKLARPDVFHPRIVLAGCPALPEGDGDDAGLVAALGKRGLHARWMSWDDPATLTADLVILRATFDYIDRLDEFMSWTHQVANLLNPARVVPWNSDKRYLADLAAAGVPTIPFFDPRIEAGETALVFIGGAQSHAFTKGPILRQPEARSPADPDFEVWDVGHQALAAAAAHLDLSPEELLYARVDVIGGRADPRVLEVALVEPSLGWMQLDEATRDRQQREFVLAVESALDRFGLGPLSHRRP